MIKKNYILSACMLVMALGLCSWGVIGHRAIGKIAEGHLTAKAAAAVKALLGDESLSMVSTYPDEIRSAPQYAYTAPWHYVNVAHGLNYEQFSTTLREMDKANIYMAMQNCIADLKNASKTKEEKVFALKFLTHLVGDMHQPMHMGRSEDSGGNGIKIKFMRKDGNLHGLWDSSLIDYAGMTYQELAKDGDTISAAQVKEWQQADITRWAWESYEESQKLYAEAAENPEFNYEYYPKHATFMKKRIAQAGIRLAGILNQIYK